MRVHWRALGGTALIGGAGLLVSAFSLSNGDFLRFMELSVNGSNWIKIAPPAAITTDITCTLENDGNPIPDSCVGDGTDASGGAAAGSDTQVQYNDGGSAFGGDAGFTFNETTDSIYLGGSMQFEGATADAFETTVVITDPTADVNFTLPNANSVAVQPSACTGSDKVSSISALGVISCTVDAGGGGATLADGDYTDIVVSGTGTIMNIDADAVGSAEIAADAVGASEIAANSVTLTTDTVGDYVAALGDGTGIDISGATGEGVTQTPNFDSTELTTLTWGTAGTAFAWTFNSGASEDPILEFSTGSIIVNSTPATSPPTLGIADEGDFRFYEEIASGTNYLRFKAPNTVTANGTCQLQDHVTAIVPDSCVGDGSDDDIPEVADFDAFSATSPLTYDTSGNTLTTSIATNRLVGRTTASTGVMEQITPDATTLSFTGLALQVIDVTCTGCLGATEIAGLAAGDITTGTFADALVDGSLEADELTLAGDVDGLANANDLDEANVEVELEGVLDLLDLQDVGTNTCAASQSVRRNAGDTAFECFTPAADDDVPEAADFTNLTASTGLVHTPTGTLLFDFTDAGADPALTVDQARFTSNATVPGNLVFEGDTANAIETRIAITDPTSTDKTFTIPDANSYPIVDKDYTDITVSASGQTWSIDADSVVLTTDTTGNYVGSVADGTGIDGTAAGEGATYTPSLDLTEISTATFGAGSFTTMVWDAGATDPTATFASNGVTWSNITSFNLGISTVLTSGNIELNHATANTLTASGGVLSIEGVALLTSTSADALFLTPAEGNAAYQPLDSDLTSWAGVTRASGFDTFATTPSSTNLRGVITDEVGTGAAMFGLISTMTDDLACTGSQVVRRNAGDTAFECATISGTGDVVGPGSAVNNNVAVFNGTTGKLIADGGATVASLQDDVPEAGDFGALALTGDVTSSGLATTLAANQKLVSITFIIDGGGSAITTGIKGDLEIPFACTVTGWTILGDQSGSIVVDVWKDTYANYPPVVGDTFAGSEKPTISATTKGQDLTITTWTGSGAIAAGDTLRFNVDSITTLTRATLSIRCSKT